MPGGGNISNNHIQITSVGCGIEVDARNGTVFGNTLSGVTTCEFAIMVYCTGDIVKNNYVSTLRPRGAALF